MANDPICPCDGAPDERTITNRPAQSRIAYRVGDFRTFRHALLSTPPKPFDQEQQLKNWRPSATDDLGTQMLEWWAYLADILTFYNERIANEILSAHGDPAGEPASVDPHPRLPATARRRRARHARGPRRRASAGDAAKRILGRQQARARRAATDLRARTPTRP